MTGPISSNLMVSPSLMEGMSALGSEAGSCGISSLASPAVSSGDAEAKASGFTAEEEPAEAPFSELIMIAWVHNNRSGFMGMHTRWAL